MEYGYDHLHFRSGDPKAAAGFYVDKFGATITAQDELGGAPVYRMDLNGMMFIISGKADYEDPLPGSTEPRYGLDHFGLKVSDMAVAAVELKAKGVEFIMEPKEIRPGLIIAFVKAPDEVSIELAQRG